MKLIVDMPDEMIKALKEGCFGAKYSMFDFVGYVLNGTPLEEELKENEKLKQELEAVKQELATFKALC